MHVTVLCFLVGYHEGNGVCGCVNMLRLGYDWFTIVIMRECSDHNDHAPLHN